MKNFKLSICILAALFLLFLPTASALAQGDPGIDFVSTGLYLDEESNALVAGGYFLNVSTVTIKGINEVTLTIHDNNKEFVTEDVFEDEGLSNITLSPGEIVEWEFHFDYFDLEDKDLEYYTYQYEFSYNFFPVPTEKGIKIFFNGKKLNLDVPARIEDNRTLVPVRGVIEQLGAKVEYDANTKKISINHGEIVLTVGSKTAIVNGKEVILDVPPKVIDNRTLVPLRFISENIDCNVHWGAKSKIVSIVRL